MNREILVKLLGLAGEANAAGDRERVARCLGLLLAACQPSYPAWESAWDAVKRDTLAALADATLAANISRGKEIK